MDIHKELSAPGDSVVVTITEHFVVRQEDIAGLSNVEVASRLLEAMWVGLDELVEQMPFACVAGETAISAPDTKED